MEGILVLVNKNGTVEGRCALSTPPQVSVISGCDLKELLEQEVAGGNFFRGNVTPPPPEHLRGESLPANVLESWAKPHPPLGETGYGCTCSF